MINTFKRVEKKYLLNKEQYTNLLKIINNNIEKDQYYESNICNIYFDADNNDLIVNSLEKPIYKEKIRLRSYNVPDIDDDVFLELKFKYNGIVGKRRIKIKLKDFYDFFNNKKINLNNQILKELAYAFNYYHLKPKYFIGYNRFSYKGRYDEGLRITFDYNLRSRTDNLQLEYGDNGKKYFDDETYIMEIKTIESIPLWLVRSLSSLKIYPYSFSKIGNIYTKDKEAFIC